MISLSIQEKTYGSTGPAEPGEPGGWAGGPLPPLDFPRLKRVELSQSARSD